MLSKLRELADIVYALAQEHSPVVVTSIDDIQQSEEYYDLLYEAFKLAVKIQTGEDVKPELFETIEEPIAH